MYDDEPEAGNGEFEGNMGGNMGEFNGDMEDDEHEAGNEELEGDNKEDK